MFRQHYPQFIAATLLYLAQIGQLQTRPDEWMNVGHLGVFHSNKEDSKRSLFPEENG